MAQTEPPAPVGPVPTEGFMLLVRDGPFTIGLVQAILDHVVVAPDTREWSELEFLRWQLRELGAKASPQVRGPNLCIVTGS